MKCKKVIVILLIFGVIAGVIGSSALAAPKNSDKSSKADLTLLDPFTLRTVMVSGAGVSDVMLTRQAIRVPLRPASRSAFRPEWR